MNNGKKVLYVILRKALYGCLKSGLLFWRHLSWSFEKQGFKINPYDTCVANKIINGKQCTITWHVDNLKISHVEQAIVDEIIYDLEKNYGPMVTQKGKGLDYLGMTLDFTKKNKVNVPMDDFIYRLLKDSPQDMQGQATSPAANFLFDTGDSTEELPE